MEGPAGPQAARSPPTAEGGGGAPKAILKALCRAHLFLDGKKHLDLQTDGPRGQKYRNETPGMQKQKAPTKLSYSGKKKDVVHGLWDFTTHREKSLLHHKKKKKKLFGRGVTFA